MADHLKIATQTLDIALLILKKESVFGGKVSQKSNYSETDRKLIARAWQKLEKDAFVYSTKSDNGVRYFISMDGLLAIENAPWPWKNKPYQYARFKERINIAWTVAKTLAIILNSIALLAFSYLTLRQQ